MRRSRHRLVTASDRLVSVLLSLTLVTAACATADPSSNAAAAVGAPTTADTLDQPATLPLRSVSADESPVRGAKSWDAGLDLGPEGIAYREPGIGRGVTEVTDNPEARQSDADRPGPGPATNETKLPAASPSAISEPAVLEECRERYVIAPGVEEEVRSRVPEQFTLRRNSNGQPLLYITAIHCQRYAANGVARATTAAAFGVSIESPDGVMCGTPWPVVGVIEPGLAGSCNNYLVFAAYDNPAVVAWARAGTPDAPVHYVKDLAFDEGDLDPISLGVPLHFHSGSTPSTYEMDLVVRERPVTVPLSAAFWFESQVGTVRVGFDTDAIALGEASGRLAVEAGSHMAHMLGTSKPESQQPFPLLAGNRWHRATLTKTLVPTDQGGGPQRSAP